jgi:hypothetical protein
MMRRNDFNHIAEVIRKRYVDGTVDKLILRDMVDDMASYFRESNAAFDKTKFLRACGFYNE